MSRVTLIGVDPGLVHTGVVAMHFHPDVLTCAVEHEAISGANVAAVKDWVTRVVTQELMELLGVWKFSTPTHHQDLRSAARIALLGAMKEDVLNGLLTRVVLDRLQLQPTTEQEVSRG